MTIAAGTRFGAYEVLAPLGAGGMGEVYRARDTRLDRAVALKVLPADYAQDADRLKRFEQEARATSALNHPNIPTVYDIGQHEGAPFIVAELLEGEELRAPVRAIGGTSSYAVTAAGERFLFVTAREEAASLQFTVVVNWAAEAKK